MKKILYCIPLLSLILAFGCSKYSDTPQSNAKTNTPYLQPKGEIPTIAEKDEVKAILDEYNQSVK